MPKIIPHLWYDDQAKEAAALYTSVFPNSRVLKMSALHDTPSGSVDLVAIDLGGQQFRLISAGPLFKFTPAVSFLVACATKDEVDALWRALSDGGSALMEIGSYPFSERYGWLQDRYGLSWQIMFRGEQPLRQTITPVLMFTEERSGSAEAAMRFYASVFPDSKIGEIARYSHEEAPDREGAVKFGSFTLAAQQFAAMDGGRGHGFGFNEAISFIVSCESQEEIDFYWTRLSADPNSEQCGWLKDRYGLSWQVTPAIMEQMLASGDPKRVARVTQAFLQMKKLDVAKLKEAYEAGS